MEERKYRKYTESFKLEALTLLESSHKKASQIEQELGITPGMLLKWRTRYQAVGRGKGEAHLEPSDLEAAKAEIRCLQRKLVETEEEREILHLPWRAVPGKKVVNIFSRSRL